VAALNRWWGYGCPAIGHRSTDQSTVGLYFADGSGGDVSALALQVGGDTADSETRLASLPVTEHLQGLALWPEPAAAGATLRLESIAPPGVRTHIATLAPRAGWERRYWLKQPLELAPGTRLDVKATWPAGAQPPASGTALLGIDVLPR
jgi:hypothetical protein